MPDEYQNPEYNTYERLSALAEGCRSNLKTAYESVEAVCEEKEALGNLATNFVISAFRTGLQANSDDVGAVTARETLASYSKNITEEAFAIGANVTALRVRKLERMLVVSKQLDRIKLAAAEHQLKDLAAVIVNYDNVVTHGFTDIEYCEESFINRADNMYGGDIAQKRSENPKSAVLNTLHQEYETQIEEIKRRKRETKTFTKSKQGIIEYHVLGDILNKIKEEETELEMYLGSRGM